MISQHVIVPAPSILAPNVIAPYVSLLIDNIHKIWNGRTQAISSNKQVSVIVG